MNANVRPIAVRPFPAARRMVTGALRVGRRAAPMHGLISVDVTEARRRLRGAPDRSFTAFIAAAVGRAAAHHREVHAYRDWRGRLVMHDYVDITTLIEVPTPEGPFPLAHLIRDADTRSVSDITREIRAVKEDVGVSPTGRMLDRAPKVMVRIPGASRLFYAVMARSVRMRRMAGTVSLTSIGMFGGGDGFGIGFPTVMSLGVLVGGLSERPLVVDGQIEVREVLDLTITIDHNIVDGAPAARFVAALRGAIESAELLEGSAPIE